MKYILIGIVLLCATAFPIEVVGTVALVFATWAAVKK